MSGYNRTQVDDLVAAVNAVKELNKAWEKSKKHRAVDDVAWKHALSEYIDGEAMTITPHLKQMNAAEPHVARRRETAAERPAPKKPLPAADEIDGLMKEIRKFTDEPERLLESHLGIFTEPAPPGKMLNSQG